MSKKLILIPETLFNQISDIAKEYDEPVEEMTEDLLNAQVTKALQEKETIFYPGLKWNVEPESLVQARMLESDIKRLQKWMQTHDALELFRGGKNELVIINNSMQKQNPQKEKIPNIEV